MCEGQVRRAPTFKRSFVGGKVRFELMGEERKFLLSWREKLRRKLCQKHTKEIVIDCDF